MSHTYATVADANNEILPGSTALDTKDVVRKLGILEAVSRRIEFVCHRSAFRSGFGPRLGTNYYDGDGSNTLRLRDDAQSIATLSIAASTGGTPVTATLNTDYYLANADGFTGPPWRFVILHGQGSPVTFGPGIRIVSTPADTVWGQSNTTVVSSATLAEDLDTSETGVDVSSGAAFSPGHTILIGSEQMYVSSISTNTLTVIRGANGTTAAAHSTGAAINVYTYDSRVRDVTLRLFMRRWKARDAGADGLDGSLDQPGIVAREGEDTIIRRGLSDLLLLGQY